METLRTKNVNEGEELKVSEEEKVDNESTPLSYIEADSPRSSVHSEAIPFEE